MFTISSYIFSHQFAIVCVCYVLKHNVFNKEMLGIAFAINVILALTIIIIIIVLSYYGIDGESIFSLFIFFLIVRQSCLKWSNLSCISFWSSELPDKFRVQTYLSLTASARSHFSALITTYHTPRSIF